MSNPEIVSKFRVNGVIYSKDDLDSEELRQMIAGRVDEVMRDTGFEKDKTA